jgi:hypothetical protein
MRQQLRPHPGIGIVEKADKGLAFGGAKIRRFHIIIPIRAARSRNAEAPVYGITTASAYVAQRAARPI